MIPSRNTRSRSKTYKESLSIIRFTSPTSHSIYKCDLNNIHNDIKAITAMTDKNHSDMETQNEQISDMLTKLTNTSSKTENNEEKLTNISSKLSNYEYRLNKLIMKETQIQPLSLQITEVSSKFLDCEKHLEKLSISNTKKIEIAMKEHEVLLNTKIDTNIVDLKAEASSSINQTLYPLNLHNFHSSSKKSSDDITQWPLLKSPDFHSRASQFTKHLSPITLQVNTLFQLQK